MQSTDHRETALLEDLLTHVPEIPLDLAGCADIGPTGLPPAVTVTLERRPDRWARAVVNFEKHGFDRMVKAAGVDGLALSTAALGRLLEAPASVDQPLIEYLQLTRPAVGCYLSHLAIWKAFARSGLPWLLIVEDDAVPAPRYVAAIARRLLAELPADADMLLLGCTVMDGLAEPTAHPLFTRIYYYNGTYAYLLTRKGCRALLPRLLPIRTHIDNQISLELVADRANLTVYASEPRLFDHDFTVRSDVYIPVADAARADRSLAAIFTQARAKLIREGARLLPAYEPPAAEIPRSAAEA